MHPLPAVGYTRDGIEGITVLLHLSQPDNQTKKNTVEMVFTLYLWSILFVLVSISRGPGRKVIYADNCDKHLQNVDPQCKWLDRNLITQCTYQASEDTFIMLVLLPWGEVLPMTNIRPYGWFVVVSGFSTIEFH